MVEPCGLVGGGSGPCEVAGGLGPCEVIGGSGSFVVGGGLGGREVGGGLGGRVGPSVSVDGPWCVVVIVVQRVVVIHPGSNDELVGIVVVTV